MVPCTSELQSHDRTGGLSWTRHFGDEITSSLFSPKVVRNDLRLFHGDIVEGVRYSHLVWVEGPKAKVFKIGRDNAWTYG